LKFETRNGTSVVSSVLLLWLSLSTRTQLTKGRRQRHIIRPNRTTRIIPSSRRLLSNFRADRRETAGTCLRKSPHFGARFKRILVCVSPFLFLGVRGLRMGFMISKEELVHYNTHNTRKIMGTFHIPSLNGEQGVVLWGKGTSTFLQRR
jgi:hypothetical protein